MNNFTFVWEERVQKSLSIKADNIEQAKRSFLMGEYDILDVDYEDCDFLGDTIEINGKEYELNE